MRKAFEKCTFFSANQWQITSEAAVILFLYCECCICYVTVTHAAHSPSSFISASSHVLLQGRSASAASSDALLAVSHSFLMISHTWKGMLHSGSIWSLWSLAATSHHPLAVKAACMPLPQKTGSEGSFAGIKTALLSSQSEVVSSHLWLEGLNVHLLILSKLFCYWVFKMAFMLAGCLDLYNLCISYFK